MPICTTCKLEKDTSAFNKAARKKSGLQPCCRECCAIHAKKYYSRRTDYHKQVVKERYAKISFENNKRVCDFLSNNPCVDCGEADILCLQFDHVRGDKANNISCMLRDCSWNTIEEEIKKCAVRCANCHQRITLKRLNSLRVQYVESVAQLAEQ